jgi:hypothetical protein
MEDQVRQDRDQAATPAGLPLESEAPLSPQIEKFSATELAITGLEVSRCSIDCLQAALEGVAYIQ